MEQKPTISVVMITYNAERFIRGSLESIKGWVDEIIIVDMFSSDNTVKVAKNYTDKVFQNKSDPAKRGEIGIDKATSDWILFIGATERIPRELKEEIIAAAKNNEHVGYHIPRNNYVTCEFIEERPGPITLFKKGSEKICYFGIHHPLTLKGKKGYLKNFKIHYSNLSIESGIEKTNRYTSRDVKMVFAGHPNAFWWRRPVYRVNLFNLLYRTLAGFYMYYILGKNYRYGLHGFIESLIGAFHFFLEMAKLWELQYKHEHNIKDELLPLD